MWLQDTTLYNIVQHCKYTHIYAYTRKYYIYTHTFLCSEPLRACLGLIYAHGDLILCSLQLKTLVYVLTGTYKYTIYVYIFIFIYLYILKPGI